MVLRVNAGVRGGISKKMECISNTLPFTASDRFFHLMSSNMRRKQLNGRVTFIAMKANIFHILQTVMYLSDCYFFAARKKKEYIKNVLFYGRPADTFLPFINHGFIQK